MKYFNLLIILIMFFVVSGCFDFDNNNLPKLVAYNIENESNIVAYNKIKVSIFGKDKDNDLIIYNLKSKNGFLLERIDENNFYYTALNGKKSDILIFVLTDEKGGVTEVKKKINITLNEAPEIMEIKINNKTEGEMISGHVNVISLNVNDKENDIISEILIVSEKGNLIQEIKNTNYDFNYEIKNEGTTDNLTFIIKDEHNNVKIIEKEIKIKKNSGPILKELKIDDTIKNTVTKGKESILTFTVEDIEGDSLKKIELVSNNNEIELIEGSLTDFTYNVVNNSNSDILEIKLIDSFNNISEFTKELEILENSSPVFEKLLINGIDHLKISKQVISKLEVIAFDIENEEIEVIIKSKVGNITKPDNDFLYTVSNDINFDEIEIILKDEYGNETKETVIVSVQENSAPSLISFLINDKENLEVFSSTTSLLKLNVLDSDNDEITEITITSVNNSKIDKKGENEYYYIPKEGINTDILTIEISDIFNNKSSFKKEINVKTLMEKDLTYIIYMAGDNDLNGEGYYDANEDYSKLDIDEIKSAQIDNTKLNVILYCDFLFDSDYVRGIYRLENNKLVNIEVFETETNTGEKDTLKDYINFVSENYPAKKYILDFWGHGTGWWDDIYGDDNNIKRAISYDWTIPNATDEINSDSLDLWEIENAIKESNIPNFEIIYADMCLMGTVEVAYQLKDVCEYLVSSPEFVPGKGGDYKGILEYLSENSKLNSKELSIEMQDINYKSYLKDGSQYNDVDETLVFTVYDLGKIETLKVMIDDAVNSLIENKHIIYEVKESVIDTETDVILTYGLESTNDVSHYVDLADFMNRITEKSKNDLNKLKYQSIVNFLNERDELIIYLKKQNGYYNGDSFKVEKSCGISIFFDFAEDNETEISSGYKEEVIEYKNASRFGIESKWTELLKEYFGVE